MTKLSRYSDGIMEASWLTAVIIAPLFFNVYSSRIFEPDKITLLRSLTLIILAAWTIKLYEDGIIREFIKGNSRNIITKILHVPIIVPVIGLIFIYIVATIFSITPAVSIWGSYQRLQGTYTFLSYIIFFAVMVANIRRWAQIDRLITTIILTSLPVSLYGVLQRYKIDPIPWGGDVSTRISSSLGNSIFVGAYLIMVFPLTIVRIIESFESLIVERNAILPDFVKATGYVFIGTLQIIALYLSGSRGPWLGWGASLVFIWLSLSLIWKKKSLTFLGVFFSIIIAIFLIGLNVQDGPLEGLRDKQAFTRISQLLDVESRTGRVRSLIWQGAFNLVIPHDPLTFPDDSRDNFNSIRPLIGYGPESMYVAFNPFYPPELTQVEKRNASPDRSHNETWDSLVITGLVGLFFYLLLFGSLFFYGLKWLGFIKTQNQKFLFFLFVILGAAVISTLFISWKGWGFFGVALPFGMTTGIILYLLLFSILGDYDFPSGSMHKLRVYILSGLISAILAHFVEINFGIAIVVTRIYFWIYAALLITLGYFYSSIEEFLITKVNDTYTSINPKNETLPEVVLGQQVQPTSLISSKGKKNRNLTTGSQKIYRRKKKSKQGLKQIRFSKHTKVSAIAGIIISIIMITLGFDFITNSQGSKLAGEILWNSFIRMKNPVEADTYGVLILTGVFLLFSISIIGSELYISINHRNRNSVMEWIKMLGLIFIVSFVITFVYWILQASLLAALARKTISTPEEVLTQVEKAFNLFRFFIIYIAFVIIFSAFLLPEDWPERPIRTKHFSYTITTIIFLLTIVFIAVSNIRVIEADMAYKSAETFSKPGTWPVAIEIFKRALEKTPKEDFYYLFLGRAYLEHAKELSDLAESERLFNQASEDLQKAQKINPLNTDHTANLARLYSLWASITDDDIKRDERAYLSSKFFETAVTLSPNNARIWDEWGLHFLGVRNEPNEALPKLQRALELDPYYDWTYALLGDYYLQLAESFPVTDFLTRENHFNEALKNYKRAVELSDQSSGLQNSNYHLAIGGINAKLGKFEEAILAYEQALNSFPDRAVLWQIFETLSRLNYQIGNIDRAIEYAQLALSNSPEDQRSRIENYLNQLQPFK